ncbi:MAG: class I SAM-dependent methyltransferase [bacterium]
MVERLKSWFRGDDREDRNEASEELWSPEMGNEYESFWDNMASDRERAYLAVAGEPYGEPATEETLSAHGRDSADIIRRMLSINSGDRVLEVGVGVGRLAEHLAGHCRTFTGIDISKNMIDIAKERLRGFSNVRLENHNKSDLSLFKDSEFDKVIFQVVLIHLDREDVFNYLRETCRVLSTGGVGWFQFYNLLHPGGFREFRFAVDYMVEKGVKTRGRVHCYTAPEVRCLVEEAGLRIREDLSALEMVEQNFSFPVPDRDWEHYLIAIGEKDG